MAQPVWVTPAGSLGTIPEGVFYSTPLEADEPVVTLTVTGTTRSGNYLTLLFATQRAIPFDVGTDVFLTGFDPTSYNDSYTVTSATKNSVTVLQPITTTIVTLGSVSNTPDTIYYQLVAGSLPQGMQINSNGIIVGVPTATANIQGVPNLVSRDVTSKFAVRAYTQKTINGITIINRLADRTFEITVSGQDAPQFITPAGLLTQCFDGSLFESFQIEYTDEDPGDIVVIRLTSGSLPPDLTISSTGLISGYIPPLTSGSGRYVYNFTLQISDGSANGISLRSFSIIVWSRSIMTADTTLITADNTFITADVDTTYVPVLFNTPGSIGTVRNDNWFAYEFIGIDPSGEDDVEYVISNQLPTAIPGLTLDPNTGWLYGAIPNLGLTEFTYTFDIQVRKKLQPDYISTAASFSLSVVGPIDTDVVWLTPSNLGTINNGAISTLYVAATVGSGQVLQYELLSGSDSNLPQGLQLFSNGDIQGRVSFNTFALDGGTTTFDVQAFTTPTTFDMTHTFTVRAFTSNGLVSVTKTFSITVVRVYDEPYDNLYIQAMPPQDDRDLINSLIQNTQIFPTDLIYRPNDPYFGVAKNVTYYHAYGLTAATLDAYVSSLDLNHYWKNLVLGNIEVAQARDANGVVIYEAVYSRIIDNLVNDAGESVSKEITLPYSIDYNDLVNVTDAYPNSLINMRDQVIDVVGRVANILPAWMTSKQTDNRVLGFTPAWVIAYAKPGKGQQIAYYIAEQFGVQLNLVDYEVDRYELDRFLSHNWDPNVTVLDILNISSNGNTVTVTYPTQSALPAIPGTNIVISEVNPSGYNGSYDVVTCSLSQITFESTYTNVYVSGGKLTLPAQWMPPPAETVFDYEITTNVSQWGNYNYIPTPPPFTTVNWVNSSGDIVIWNNNYNGEQTIFDGGSLKFIAPVDMYVGTLANPQQYDKYLVFPKRNILE